MSREAKRALQNLGIVVVVAYPISLSIVYTFQLSALPNFLTSFFVGLVVAIFVCIIRDPFE